MGPRGGRRSALVALVGEPGIGKSRLAAEPAAHALADGATVRYATAKDSRDVVRGVLEPVRDSTNPTLLVVDHVDEAPQDMRADLEEVALAAAAAPVLVLVLSDDGGSLANLAPAASLVLGPLDLPAVQAIALRYVPGHGSTDVPANGCFRRATAFRHVCTSWRESGPGARQRGA